MRMRVVFIGHVPVRMPRRRMLVRMAVGARGQMVVLVAVVSVFVDVCVFMLHQHMLVGM